MKNKGKKGESLEKGPVCSKPIPFERPTPLGIMGPNEGFLEMYASIP